MFYSGATWCWCMQTDNRKVLTTQSAWYYFIEFLSICRQLNWNSSQANQASHACRYIAIPNNLPHFVYCLHCHSPNALSGCSNSKNSYKILACILFVCLVWQVVRHLTFLPYHKPSQFSISVPANTLCLCLSHSLSHWLHCPSYVGFWLFSTKVFKSS